MQKGIILLGLALSASTLHAEEAQVNYCKDPVENQNWVDFLDKHPHDPIFIKLYALRAGLCELVDQGRITVDQATEIFEQERGRAIIERHTEELRRAPRFGA